jgi:hypothetical protein
MLCASSAKIGIREGRRIIGDYILTQQDILENPEGLDFNDGVAIATSQIDFHSLTKAGHAGWRQEIPPYAIPFRCLCAKDFENLMMAGKCISADQVAHASSRMTPTCCCMGQAAGTAAALAEESRAKNIRDISIAELRKILRADGIELNPSLHTPFAPEVTAESKEQAV